jgi:uncharacterized membrane protein (UPF0136 family)
VKGGLADVDADRCRAHEMILLTSFAGRCYFTRRTISLGLITTVDISSWRVFVFGMFLAGALIGLDDIILPLRAS